MMMDVILSDINAFHQFFWRIAGCETQDDLVECSVLEFQHPAMRNPST